MLNYQPVCVGSPPVAVSRYRHLIDLMLMMDCSFGLISLTALQKRCFIQLVFSFVFESQFAAYSNKITKVLQRGFIKPTDKYKYKQFGINKIYVNKSWSQELQFKMKYVINIWCIRNSDVFNGSWSQVSRRLSLPETTSGSWTLCMCLRPSFKITSNPPSTDQQINKDKNTSWLYLHCSAGRRHSAHVLSSDVASNLFFLSSAASMRTNTKTSSEPNSSVGFSHLFSVLATWQEWVRRDSLGIRSSFNVRPRVWQRNNNSSNTHRSNESRKSCCIFQHESQIVPLVLLQWIKRERAEAPSLNLILMLKTCVANKPGMDYITRTDGNEAFRDSLMQAGLWRRRRRRTQSVELQMELQVGGEEDEELCCLFL